MDFQPPIFCTDLGGKTITMLTDVSVADCAEHLKITADSATITIGQDGIIRADGDVFNTLSCSGRVITFGDYEVSTGPTYISFAWE